MFRIYSNVHFVYNVCHKMSTETSWLLRNLSQMPLNDHWQRSCPNSQSFYQRSWCIANFLSNVMIVFPFKLRYQRLPYNPSWLSWSPEWINLRVTLTCIGSNSSLTGSYRLKPVCFETWEWANWCSYLIISKPTTDFEIFEFTWSLLVFLEWNILNY